MLRTFEITLPANTNAHSLWDQILLQTGAVPTDGYLPDRVCHLEIQSDITNAAAKVEIVDRNNANTDGPVILAGDSFVRTSSRNSLCVKDYYLQPDTNSMVIRVAMETI